MKRRMLAVLAAAALSLALAQGTIIEVAQADDRFETLVTAVTEAGLVDMLNGEGPFTVFAPTDRAFARLAGLGELMSQPEILRRILLYHVVPDLVSAAEVAAQSPLATALPGAVIEIRVVDGTIYVGDAIVTITDVEASNGVIHVVDTVLRPPPTASETESSAAP